MSGARKMSDEDKRDKKKQKKCPKCATELHFIENQRQHYCYGCEVYYDATGKPIKIEPEEEIPEDLEEGEEAETEKIQCPSCGEPASHVKETDSFYCYACEEYIAGEGPEAEKVEDIGLRDTIKSIETEQEPASKLEITPESEETESEETDDSIIFVEEKPVLYAEPEKKPSKEKQKVRKVRTRTCDSCGAELIHVEKYDRWYCHRCRKYAPKESKEEKKRKCPNCGVDAKFISQYSRWYCWTCRQYLPKDVARAAAISREKDTSLVVSKCEYCGGPTSLIAKYERYYCFSCKKYAPKGAAKRSRDEASAVSAAPLCAECDRPTVWIEKYGRYYCYPCKKYVPRKGSGSS